jgi:acyl transferase domain-containing protein
MATSAWRAQRNATALARLRRNLPEIFPAPVLLHALARPFIPPTPRRAIESYWRQHPLRADRLARALAALSGAPESWTWRIDKPGSPASFRAPPVPFREESHAKGPGYCCVCGQPVFRFGWHRDLWGDGPNRNAGWHACCVAAWNLWTAPSDHVLHLRRRQKHRCAVTGARLAKNAEVDHRVPLFEISRASERGSQTWPALLRYWGAPNLQVINRLAHVEKCGLESAARARLRQASKAPDLSAD